MDTLIDATPETTRKTTDPVLEVEDLQVRFPTEDGVVNAVRGVSFSVRPGEVLGIVGESGSGKSVTSLAIMGLLPDSARITGSIRYRGRELLGLRDGEMSAIRGKSVAMVFQDPMTSLDPVYKVGTQIAEGVRQHDKSVSRKAAAARAVELLELVGIPNAADRAESFPHEFSGGMRQRVVIAIAMANEPDVIIADEPTTALDVTVQAQVLEVLKTAREETGAATLLITHDLGVVAGMADRILVMYAGRPVEFGTVDDVFYAPRMPYTIGLLGSLPRLDAARERLTPIKGAPPSLIKPPPGCPFGPRCPLHFERCDEAEPDLVLVDGDRHYAACYRSEELIATDVEPEDIFGTGTSDAELAAATAIGVRADVELGALVDPDTFEPIVGSSTDGGPAALSTSEPAAAPAPAPTAPGAGPTEPDPSRAGPAEVGPGEVGPGEVARAEEEKDR
jgi:oligopeptide/dipeptide ABC transporter ATP-binding protein